MTTAYRKVKREVEHDVFMRCWCDWCKTDLPPDYGNGLYRIRTFTLEYVEGDSYPGSMDVSGWGVADLCNACVAKLRKTLEDLGCTTSDIKRSY